MDTALWVAQIALAAMFLMAAMMKLVMNHQTLGARMGWVRDFTPSQVRGIGLLEVAAAMGLVLPGLTGIAPVLTPLAAVSLVLLMLGAMRTHLRRGEPMFMVINAMLLAAAVFIAWGRFGPEPL